MPRYSFSPWSAVYGPPLDPRMAGPRTASPVRWLSRPEFEAIYPRSYGWDDDPLVPDIHVPDHRPIDTGLLNERGHRIMREPNPMGFGRDGEW